MDTSWAGSRTLSKKKYEEIAQALQAEHGKVVTDNVLSIIRNVMKFDPNMSTYTKQHASYIKEYRERKKEQGISIYVSSGLKKFREKQKLAKASEQENKTI